MKRAGFRGRKSGFWIQISKNGCPADRVWEGIVGIGHPPPEADRQNDRSETSEREKRKAAGNGFPAAEGEAKKL
jgi:hypothetical protein